MKQDKKQKDYNPSFKKKSDDEIWTEWVDEYRIIIRNIRINEISNNAHDLDKTKILVKKILG